jgi:ATP-dependent DNA helicase DinG
VPRGDDVAATLAAVAAALPGGGEDRPGQLHMAQAVGRAIDERRHLVVQAGTGTGKSLAYLLPAVRSGRRVVVATATKALQDQLATKDLPFLAEQLGDASAFTFAVLKGRSNYLCRQRAAEVVGRVRDPRQAADTPPADAPGGRRLFAMTGEPGDVAAGPSADDLPGDDLPGDDLTDAAATGAEPPAGDVGGLADQVRRLVAWGDVSPTGDRGDLDFEPHPRAWSMLSVTARECPGAFRCPSGGDCFAEAARARAAAADVVVVNTHLYATHVASDGAVLPEHDVVVFDEAHEVEDVMTSGLGIEITPGRFRAVAQAARAVVAAEDAGIADGVSEVADRLGDAMRAGAGRRVLTTFNADVDANVTDIAVERRDIELANVLELGRGRLDALVGALRRADARAPADGDEHSTRRRRAVQAAGHVVGDLQALAAIGPDQVAWVESSGPGGRALTLRMAPVEIGPVLAEQLWPTVTAVMTSATVPPLLEARLGLPADNTDRLDVGSPFPYETCALLYCATHLPDRRSPEAERAIHAELIRLVRAAGGRTLALFTSWRAMQGAVEAARAELEYPVLAQNDLPKARLVEAFAADDEACLFATMSFWQGIDVPGPTLSLVAVDRIPFPRPDDPLLEARRERSGEAAFRVVDLPRAATLLAQGAGRLIRSATDTGVVAVLDRRLATAGYRRTLLAALPPMRLSTDPGEVVAFLERLRAGEKARAGPPGQ